MIIRILVEKWGEDLGLRLPSDLVEKAGLDANSSVDVEVRADGALVIGRFRRRYTLEELVAGMAPDRQHPLMLDDAPRGSELL